jgi:hypothetical protein
MSVHATQETPQITITSTAVKLTLNTSAVIEALKICAWELSIVDNRVYQVAEHYETTAGVWIDVETIVNVSYFQDSSSSVQWFTDGSSFYYWEDGAYYYSDSSLYTGPTDNWEIVNTTINNSVSESWAFSIAYEFTAIGVFVACTKAIKITNTGTLVIRYFRANVEIFPEIVEDVIPPAIYRWDEITINSGNVFDLRQYAYSVAGIAISYYQQRPRRLPNGSRSPASSVTVNWFEGDVIRQSSINIHNEVVQINAEGGQELIEKDFTIAPIDGASVKLRIRQLHYPLTARQSAPIVDTDMAELEAEVGTSMHQS